MTGRDNDSWIRSILFIILDLLALELSLLIAYFIRQGHSNPFSDEIYLRIQVVLILIDLIYILATRTYRNTFHRGYYKELKSVVIQGGVLFLCATAYAFLLKIGGSYSRMIIILTSVFYIIIAYVFRLLFKKSVKKASNTNNGDALLIMADSEDLDKIVQSIRDDIESGYRIVGLVSSKKEDVNQMINGVKVVADYDDVVEYVTKNWVDEIMVSSRAGHVPVKDILEELSYMGATVHYCIHAIEADAGIKQNVEKMGDYYVLSSNIHYMNFTQRFIKRTADIIISIFGCMVTGILYLFVAPAIKRESPGPAIFSQIRIGKNGKPFKFYKFRSMYLDAEERRAELMSKNRLGNDLMFKMDFDPRVIGNIIDENGNRKTGIGEFIRKTSIDEFPQFWNVLTGDMSLVGTRPPLMSEYNKYSAHHKSRLAVKPGITGLWQVSGRSDILDFEEVVRLDNKYIREFDLGMDLRILVKTIAVVFAKKGSM